MAVTIDYNNTEAIGLQKYNSRWTPIANQNIKYKIIPVVLNNEISCFNL